MLYHFPFGVQIITRLIFDYFTDSHVSVNRGSHKLLVTNLPESADEEHLEMFFEHTKRQGGGPVKSVLLYKDKKQAIVEFEEADAVQIVLSKIPIKMLGTTVRVEQYEPYLEKDETLKCIEIGGILTNLAKEIADMRLNHTIVDNDWDNDLTDFDIQSGFYNPFGDASDDDEDIFSADIQQEKEFRHVGFGCDGCDGAIYGIRYKCTRCVDFDFCSSCRHKVPHNSKHKFKEIKHPLMP